ncbi:hypothetical protein [Streptomyces achromogenes]|uniref:hypothetical protein n=1 Tax=Streptomyces achromogenes TaxID=67255 RepID=UPI000691CCEA|nr:hypothetical protein [Streptomyces achromogenes]
MTRANIPDVPSARQVDQGGDVDGVAEGHVVPTSERNLAVEHWLLTSVPSAEEARTSWDRFGVALLHCGVVFTTVRMNGDLVHAAADSSDPHTVSAYLTQALAGGPVVVDTHGHKRYYALVPVSTIDRPEWADDRHAPVADCMTNGFVGIPRPGITEPDDCFTYWCVPMDRPGVLCAPEAVSELVSYGMLRLKAGAAGCGE